MRADQGLETWRPRVHGSQLKAIAGARLPETPVELQRVREAFELHRACLRPGSTPDAVVAELTRFTASVEAWWDMRNKRQVPPSGSGESEAAS